MFNSWFYQELNMTKKKNDYTKLENDIDIKAFRDSIESSFQQIKDPRNDDKVYPLSSILIIMITAVIAGANHIAAIHEYAVAKQDLFKEVLQLEYIPSYSTFWWVLTRMNPIEFEDSFRRWVATIPQEIQDRIIAIDGKRICGASKRKGNAIIHFVSAWYSYDRLILGQVKTEEKSNEVKAIPELLNAIDIQGAIITIDAIGCQREIVKTIIENRGDYVIALKGNQGTLCDAVQYFFEGAREVNFCGVANCDFHNSIEKGHGRIESRSISITTGIDWLLDEEKDKWKGLQSCIEVSSERTIDGETAKERRYYISSLDVSAKRFGEIVREHWGVENPLHWVLDVVFLDDACLANTGHGGENLGILRRIALNLFNQDKTVKGGVASKRRKAMWNDEYAIHLVKEMFVKEF